VICLQKKIMCYYTFHMKNFFYWICMLYMYVIQI